MRPSPSADSLEVLDEIECKVEFITEKERINIEHGNHPTSQIDQNGDLQTTHLENTEVSSPQPQCRGIKRILFILIALLVLTILAISISLSLLFPRGGTNGARAEAQNGTAATTRPALNGSTKQISAAVVEKSLDKNGRMDDVGEMFRKRNSSHQTLFRNGTYYMYRKGNTTYGFDYSSLIPFINHPDDN